MFSKLPNSECPEVLPKELTCATLRRGKWTVEEERYTEKIIADFENGTLDVPEGTTLRTFLSKVLNCDPMRITKKYTGNSSIGKRTFTPLVRTPENIPYIEMSQRELEDLRRNWISKLLLAEQWNNRKMNMMKTSTPGAGGNSPSLHGGNGMTRTLSNNYLDALDARNAHDLNNSSHGSVGSNAGPPPPFLPFAFPPVPPEGEESEELMKIREENIYHALKPYISDPVQIESIVQWLKTSCYVLKQNSTNVHELNQLIQIGELSLPVLHKVMLSGDLMLKSCAAANAHAMASANTAAPAGIAPPFYPNLMSSDYAQKLIENNLLAQSMKTIDMNHNHSNGNSIPAVSSSSSSKLHASTSEESSSSCSSTSSSSTSPVMTDNEHDTSCEKSISEYSSPANHPMDSNSSSSSAIDTKQAVTSGKTTTTPVAAVSSSSSTRKRERERDDPVISVAHSTPPSSSSSGSTSMNHQINPIGTGMARYPYYASLEDYYAITNTATAATNNNMNMTSTPGRYAPTHYPPHHHPHYSNHHPTGPHPSTHTHSPSQKIDSVPVHSTPRGGVIPAPAAPSLSSNYYQEYIHMYYAYIQQQQQHQQAAAAANGGHTAVMPPYPYYPPPGEIFYQLPPPYMTSSLPVPVQVQPVSAPHAPVSTTTNNNNTTSHNTTTSNIRNKGTLPSSGHSPSLPPSMSPSMTAAAPYPWIMIQPPPPPSSSSSSSCIPPIPTPPTAATNLPGTTLSDSLHHQSMMNGGGSSSSNSSSKRLWYGSVPPIVFPVQSTPPVVPPNAPPTPSSDLAMGSLLTDIKNNRRSFVDLQSMDTTTTTTTTIPTTAAVLLHAHAPPIAVVDTSVEDSDIGLPLEEDSYHGGVSKRVKYTSTPTTTTSDPSQHAMIESAAQALLGLFHA